MSRVCSTFQELTDHQIENIAKISVGEPQTKAQLLKIANFQRIYKTLSIDEFQHANEILNQLLALTLTQIHLELDIHSEDRVYLISTLKTITDKFQNMLLSITLNFQFEVDEILLRELLEAGLCSSVKRFVYENKFPKKLKETLTNFKNIKHLSLNCSKDLPDLSDVRLRKLEDLTFSGICSLDKVAMLAQHLKALKISSQLDQVKILEKIINNNKQSLKKLDLCIVNFDINEPTKILNLVHPLRNLVELALSSAVITKGLVKWMKSNPFLKKLTFYCCDFDKESEITLEFFEGIHELNWISLDLDSEEKFYESLIYFSSMERLTLFSYVKTDLKLEKTAVLTELRYLFVDIQGFGSLVQNMKAPLLNQLVLHFKGTAVDLKDVSEKIKLLAENSLQIEKINFDLRKFEYSKEDFLEMLEVIFKNLSNLKDFSIKMEFDENFNDFCEKIQTVDTMETAVIRTWSDNLEEKEVLCQKFTDKIRIEFDFCENKVHFYFPS